MNKITPLVFLFYKILTIFIWWYFYDWSLKSFIDTISFSFKQIRSKVKYVCVCVCLRNMTGKSKLYRLFIYLMLIHFNAYFRVSFDDDCKKFNFRQQNWKIFLCGYNVLFN